MLSTAMQFILRMDFKFSQGETMLNMQITSITSFNKYY